MHQRTECDSFHHRFSNRLPLMLNQSGNIKYSIVKLRPQTLSLKPKTNSTWADTKILQATTNPPLNLHMKGWSHKKSKRNKPYNEVLGAVLSFQSI